jgi:hypothetical protein
VARVATLWLSDGVQRWVAIVSSALVWLAAGEALAQEHQAADSGRAAGRDGRPSLEQIAAQLDELAESPGAMHAAGDAIRHARRALTRSRDLTRQGRLDAAERARLIAWAAQLLAEREVALARERHALADARRRLDASRARAAAAREALENALRQRARSVERQGEQSGPVEEPEEGEPE